ESFLYYYLPIPLKQINDATPSVTVKHLSSTSLQKLHFPLPPISEQQRIVNRIESMFAKLDKAKEKAQNVVDCFETRKAAILHQAFTGNLTAKWRKENGVSDDSWKEKSIGECCKLGSGGTPSKSHPEYYDNGDIPWLKTGEIDWNDIYEVEEKITQEGMKNSSAKIYPAESVVIAMYGMGVTRGKAGILKIPTTTNQAVCVLQPDTALFNRYLFYYFMRNYWTFREKAVGGNQLNYSATMISKWTIDLPSLPEQQEIVRILDTVLEKESAAKFAAEQILEQIDLLKKSILARAFRGEL
ncbi:MAG: restriction endonuclease subunit S, partial [Lachnospiraceae bacterium]|nr:restriction endonuclease subunit S [Lachnospiraceae bacterium]